MDLALSAVDSPVFFHVGMVVDDLDAACEEYSRLFGVRWTDTSKTWALPVLVDNEPRTVELQVAYTVDGPPFFEFVHEVSGDTWGANALNLNHVGFWARDLKDASARLESAGVPPILRDAAKTNFTYHRTASGIWVELCEAVSNVTIIQSLIDESLGQ